MTHRSALGPPGDNAHGVTHSTMQRHIRARPLPVFPTSLVGLEVAFHLAYRRGFIQQKKARAQALQAVEQLIFLTSVRLSNVNQRVLQVVLPPCPTECLKGQMYQALWDARPQGSVQ